MMREPDTEVDVAATRWEDGTEARSERPASPGRAQHDQEEAVAGAQSGGGRGRWGPRWTTDWTWRGRGGKGVVITFSFYNF